MGTREVGAARPLGSLAFATVSKAGTGTVVQLVGGDVAESPVGVDFKRVLRTLKCSVTDLELLNDEDLHTLANECERLTSQDAALIIAHATRVGALFHAGRWPEAIAVGRPVFDAVCALMPQATDPVNIPAVGTNRDFHQLALNLVQSYFDADDPNVREQGRAIALAMQRWCPEDAFGFSVYARPS